MKVYAIYDNGGESLDRYTIVTTNITGREKGRLVYDCIASSETGVDIFAWCKCTIGEHLGKRIQWETLDKGLQDRINNALD